MKKLFTLLALIAFTSCAFAQVVKPMVLSAATLTNASTVTATLQTVASAENITLQAIADKNSGTVAGTITVSGSLDGVNYVNVPDSFTMTNVSRNSHLWEFTKNNYLYYKATFVGTGTMSIAPKAYLFSSGTGSTRVIKNFVDNIENAVDTVVNTATSDLTIQVDNWYNRVTIQSVVTKISGTVGGTITLQGSVDGNNFNTVDPAYVTATSYSPTNVATSTKIFVVTGSPYKYYRLSYTGTGTMSASHRGYVLPSKN